MRNEKTELLFNRYNKRVDYTAKIEARVAQNKLEVGIGIAMETINAYLAEGNKEKALQRYESAGEDVKRNFKEMLEVRGIWK